MVESVGGCVDGWEASWEVGQVTCKVGGIPSVGGEFVGGFVFVLLP